MTDNNKITVIESPDYEQTRQRLMRDPIVIDMAKGLLRESRNDLVHEGSDTPRHEFMLAANAEYRRRGGTDGGHLGAVPEALIRLYDAERAKQSKTIDDKLAMDCIATAMSCEAWSPDTLDRIAEIVRLTGREIGEPE